MPDGFGKVMRGTIAMPVRIFGKAPRVVYLGAPVIEPNGVAKIRDRAFEIVLLDPAVAQEAHIAIVANATAQVIVTRAIGVAADGFVKIRNCVVGVGLVEESFGARFVAVDKIRIEAQCGREVRDRRIELAVGGFDKSAVVVGA